MDPPVRLRIGIRLKDIHSTVDPAGVLFYSTYLWTVFFKVDGETTVINKSFKLQGRATVVGTLGDHGDLGNNNQPGDTAIPLQLGDFRTVLQPILNYGFPGQDVGGIVGCVAILLAQRGTPDDAVAKGHAALNSTLQSELDKLIVTLGLRNPEPTKEDIDAITQRIGDTVNSTITDNVSIWQFLGALGEEDFKVITAVFRFSYNDLMNADPTGIPLQSQKMTKPVLPPPTLNTWQLSGLIFADPFDFSLKRSLAFRHLDPQGGIRNQMTRDSISSLRSWIISTSPTFFLQVITAPPPSH